MSFRKIISKSYANYKGYSLNKKLVVIESDDWGSIRMRNKQSIMNLESDNVPVGSSKFTLYDGLERGDDLELLFEVLSKVKDSSGLHACITPLTLCSNPDFNLIARSDFKQYFSEDIATTYKNYGESSILDLWKQEGVTNKLFYPQFHGKEHINSLRWLKAIQNKETIARKAFDCESLLGTKAEFSKQSQNYMAAFEAINDEEEKTVDESCRAGLDEFEKIWGFRSISAIPSQSILSNRSKRSLLEGGVRYLQCGQHFIPNESSLKKVDYFWGHKDSFGMKYWRRNVNFEPYKNSSIDHVDKALEEISLAFRFGKPAVISSHRINYTSRITTSVRDKSLRQLEALLKKIVLKWPDVQFITSEELALKMDKSEISRK